MKTHSLLFFLLLSLSTSCGKKDDDNKTSSDSGSITITQELSCNELNQLDTKTVLACMHYKAVTAAYQCDQGGTATTSCSTTGILATCDGATRDGAGPYTRYYYSVVPTNAQSSCESEGGTYTTS